MSEGFAAVFEDVAVAVDVALDPVFAVLEGVVEGFTLSGSAGDDCGGGMLGFKRS